jgi:polar amino acid transport system substrate-binding protein
LMTGSRKYVVRTFLPALIIFVLCCRPPAGYADGRPFLQVTEQEKAFVADHPVIRVSNEMDWPPFDFAVGDQAFGLSIDLMEMLSSRLGITFEYINGYRWNELLKMFKNKELDVLQSAYMNQERRQFGLFTRPFYKDKTVFVVPVHSPGIFDISALAGKIIAVPKGWAYESYLSDNYPDINLLTVKNIEEAFAAVIDGKADAAIELSAVARYLIKKNFLTGLKISGWFNEYDNNDQKALHIMVRKDWPILHNMLEKALLTITPGDISALEHKWLGDSQISPVRDLNLTHPEEAFIETHPKIRVANEMDWPPFDFMQNGEPAGLAIDYIRLLAQIIGVELEFINGYTWSELLEKGRRRQIDLFPGLWKSADREEFLSFTSPYIQLINVLVTRKNMHRIDSLADMKNKKIVMPAGYTLTQLVMDQYPNHEYMLVKNPAEGLKLVSLGKADGFIGSLGIINYLIKKLFLNNVHVAAEIALDRDLPLYMAVRKDWTLLAGILDKAMKQVDSSQYDAIVNKWIGSMEQTGDMVTLTRAEKAYLAGKTHISMCVQADFHPFEAIHANGDYQGILADFYDLMGKKTGVPIRAVKTDSPDDARNLIKTGACDMISMVTQNDIDSDLITATTPYIAYPLVIATDSRALYINTIEAIAEKPIGISSAAPFFHDIKNRYPDINFIPVETVETGLVKVQSGELFALVDTAPKIGFHIQENQMVDLKISGEMPYQIRFRTGISKNDTMLHSIFEKAIHSVTDEDKKHIFQTWMTLKYEQGFDYGLLWTIALVMGIIGFFAIYRHISVSRYNIRLAGLNRELTKANKKLETISYLDGLTGIPNRRKFDEVLENEWKRCERTGQVLTLMMLDIDFFKPFNDRYGHLEGDDCLKKVAKTIEALPGRPGDFVGRYGGEEFAIVLPGTDDAGAGQLARKMLSRIQELQIPNKDSEVSPYLTVSIGGISAMPNRSIPGTWFLHKADQLLYRAKQGGRNQYRLEKL